ncbi:hypothetical protein [Nonomuraea maritima]|uniref:hypothetical protein n=1 Tax=Nonomuraea maritima TaxID=683260 RepID=UPI0037126BE7
MFIPVSQAVAGVSAGFPAVEAGGPPPKPAKAAPAPRPVRVVKQIRREKPVLLPPRSRRSWRHDNVDAVVDNFNDNFNREERRHRHFPRHHHFPRWWGPTPSMTGATTLADDAGLQNDMGDLVD